MWTRSLRFGLKKLVDLLLNFQEFYVVLRYLTVSSACIVNWHFCGIGIRIVAKNIKQEVGPRTDPCGTLAFIGHIPPIIYRYNIITYMSRHHLSALSRIIRNTFVGSAYQSNACHYRSADCGGGGVASSSSQHYNNVFGGQGARVGWFTTIGSTRVMILLYRAHPMTERNGRCSPAVKIADSSSGW